MDEAKLERPGCETLRDTAYYCHSDTAYYCRSPWTDCESPALSGHPLAGPKGLPDCPLWHHRKMHGARDTTCSCRGQSHVHLSSPRPLSTILITLETARGCILSIGTLAKLPYAENVMRLDAAACAVSYFTPREPDPVGVACMMVKSRNFMFLYITVACTTRYASG